MTEPIPIIHKDPECQLLIDCMVDSISAGRLLDYEDVGHFYEVINLIHEQECFKDLVNLSEIQRYYVIEPINARIQECKEHLKLIIKLREQRQKNEKSLNCLAYSYTPPLGHSYILEKFLELIK